MNRRIEASLIDARNKPSRKMVEGIGMTVYERWRVFELNLTPTPSAPCAASAEADG